MPVWCDIVYLIGQSDVQAKPELRSRKCRAPPQANPAQSLSSKSRDNLSSAIIYTVKAGHGVRRKKCLIKFFDLDLVFETRQEAWLMTWIIKVNSGSSNNFFLLLI